MGECGAADSQAITSLFTNICVRASTKPFSALLRMRSLYDLIHDEFELVIEILKEWRFSRHYTSKSKAFAAAYFARDFLDESKKFLLKAEIEA